MEQSNQSDTEEDAEFDERLSRVEEQSAHISSVVNRMLALKGEYDMGVKICREDVEAYHRDRESINHFFSNLRIDDSIKYCWLSERGERCANCEGGAECSSCEKCNNCRAYVANQSALAVSKRLANEDRAKENAIHFGKTRTHNQKGNLKDAFVWVTYTVAPGNYVPVTSVKRFKKTFKKCFNPLPAVVGFVTAVYAIEHLNGTDHFHGLLRWNPDLGTQTKIKKDYFTVKNVSTKKNEHQDRRTGKLVEQEVWIERLLRGNNVRNVYNYIGKWNQRYQYLKSARVDRKKPYVRVIDQGSILEGVDGKVDDDNWKPTLKGNN